MILKNQRFQTDKFLENYLKKNPIRNIKLIKYDTYASNYYKPEHQTQIHRISKFSRKSRISGEWSRYVFILKFKYTFFVSTSNILQKSIMIDWKFSALQISSKSCLIHDCEDFCNRNTAKNMDAKNP